MESIERRQVSKIEIGDAYGESQKETTSKVKKPELKGNQEDQRQKKVIGWAKENIQKREEELDSHKLRIEKIKLGMKNRETVKSDKENARINKILIAIKKEELSLIRRKHKIKRLEAVISYQTLKDKIK